MTTLGENPNTCEATGSAPLSTWEAKYKDLLRRLGCCSHDGAIKEIAAIRQRAGLDDMPNTDISDRARNQD